MVNNLKSKLDRIESSAYRFFDMYLEKGKTNNPKNKLDITTNRLLEKLCTYNKNLIEKLFS